MDVLVCYIRGVLTVQEILGVYKALEIFVARRLICNMGTASMNRAIPTWFKQTEQLRKGHPDSAFDDVFRRLLLRGSGRTRVFPNDAEVRNAVENYPMGTYVTRLLNYILACIEDSIQPNESRLLLRLRQGEIKLSLEHIMPQKLSNAWRRALGDNAAAIHETWLNRLANLTLTGYNSTYSNKPFSEKKGCEHGFIKSPLNINRYVAGYEVWNEVALKEREAWLADRILLAWPTLTSSVSSDDESRPGRHSICASISVTHSKPIYGIGRAHV